jgi:hypothetical protein
MEKCILSYVGNNLVTKINTINNIKLRIKTNEVKLGLIVKIKNVEPIVGWIIKLLRDALPNLEIYFIDDSIENIKSVFKIRDKKIHIYYINKYKNPKEYLIKILKNI